MSNAESLGFKVGTMSSDDDKKKRKCNLRPMSYAKLCAWIDNQSIENALKEELKRIAASYPQQALEVWPANYRKYLAKAQANLKNKRKNEVKPIVELGDEPPEEVYEDMPKDFDDF